MITGNNGVDNAVNIGLSGMNLVTTTNGTTSTTEVNLPWTTTQQAVGQTAVTNFTAYNSLGVPVQVQLTAALESQTGGQTTYQWFADLRQPTRRQLGDRRWHGPNHLRFQRKLRFGDIRPGYDPSE